MEIDSLAATICICFPGSKGWTIWQEHAIAYAVSPYLKVQPVSEVHSVALVSALR